MLPIVFSEFSKINGDTIYWKTDTAPTFIGGNKSVNEHIEEMVNKYVLEGEGLVRFIVAKDGTAYDATVVKETRPFLQKEALLKVINSMTAWQPAIRDGKPVYSFVVLPLSFKKKEFVYIIDPPMPTYRGGVDAMCKFVNSNIQFSGEQPFTGKMKIVVKFTVDRDGKVKNPHLIRSSDTILDKEVLRVVSLMPDWIPASSNGENVDAEFTLPVIFKLQP